MGANWTLSYEYNIFVNIYLEEVYIAKRSYEIQVLNTTDEEAKSSDTDIIGVNVEFDIGGKHHVGVVTDVSGGKYHIQDVDTKIITPLEEGQFFIPLPENMEEDKITIHKKPRQNSISTDIYNNNNLTEFPAKRLRSFSNSSNSSTSSSSGVYSRTRESGFSSNINSEEEEIDENRRDFEEEEGKEEEEERNNNNNGDDDYLNEIDFTSHMDYKFEKPFFYQRWLNYLYNEQRKVHNYPLLENKRCKYCGKEYSDSKNKNKYCWNSNCISSPCFKSKPFISIITINHPIKKRRIRISSNISSKDSSPSDENCSNTSNSNSGRESESSSSFDSTDQSYTVKFNLYIHFL